MEFGSSVRQIIMLGVLVLICICFGFLTSGTFITYRNLSNLCLQASATGVVSVGIVWILVSGQMDLSVGSVVGFMGALAANLMINHNWATIPTILFVVACGALVGAWQGFWVAFIKIPSFIVTLAGMQIFRGACLMATGGYTLSPMKDLYKAIGQAYVPGIVFKEKGFVDSAIIIMVVASVILAVLELRRVRSRKQYDLEVAPMWFIWIKILIKSALLIFGGVLLSRHLGFPVAFIFLILLAVIFSFVSNNTRFGKYIYAIGGNREAASLSGINIQKVTFLVFVIMGVMCSFSSIIYTARLNAATQGAGNGMEMDAIAAAIIGGTSTMGGEGNIYGAIIGAFIMTAIDNGMSIMNLEPQVQYVVKGLVLLAAVWLDVSSRKGKKNS